MSDEDEVLQETLDDIDRAILLLENSKHRFLSNVKSHKDARRILTKAEKALVLARADVQESFGKKEDESI